MEMQDNNPNRNQNGYNNNHNNYNSGGSNQPYPYNYPPPARLQGNSFSTAAMILGIISIPSTAFLPIYLPFILGSLAILFALLSKGRALKLSGNALVGTICGAIGMGVNAALFGIYAFAFLALFSEPDLMRNTAQTYDDMIEQMYGVPTEDIFGESMEDMIEDIFRFSE
jgi:hypothetical protein